MKIIKTDILIIGGGPTGLFTVFEAGLLGLKCHIIDALSKPGGQCSEIYPKKPIFDIPAIPEILAGNLINNLLEQAEKKLQDNNSTDKEKYIISYQIDTLKEINR